MKSYYMKLLTAALSASMVLSVTACITSCNREADKNDPNKSHSGMKISSSSPWYEARDYTVEMGKDKDRKIGAYCYSQYLGGDDKYVLIRTTGEYEHPDKDYAETDDQIETISVADRNTGETLKVIDLFKALPKNCWPSDAQYRNGTINITAINWNEDTQISETREVKIDPETGKIVEDKKAEDDYYEKETTDLGDYSIDSIPQYGSNTGDDAYFLLDIKAPDGTVKRIELKEEGKGLYMQPRFVPVSKTETLVYTMGGGGEYFYKLDLTSGKLTKQDAKDYEWLNMSAMYDMVMGSDGNLYTTRETGIWKINTDKKCLEEVLSYSWCDVQRSKITGLTLHDVTDDSILLGSENYERGKFGFYGPNNASGYSFVSLKKAQTNPHAGKQILEMYAPYGWVNDAVYDKIVEFNNTNGKYFIEITDRYTQEYEAPTSEDEDESSMQVIVSSSKLANKLAMDIMNGNGPDMFYDPDCFGSLNYKEHLADLTPYVGNLERDKYFTNVIELAKRDGKLYEVPLGVGLYGILTDAKYAGRSGQGFTTEEYEKFLSETLNGKDIIKGSQPYYFAELFNAMNGRFIKDGKADFTGEDFRTLAEFVRNNVPERALPQPVPGDGEEFDPYDEWYSLTPAICTTAGSYDLFFENVERLIGDPAMLGLPSPDGSGPLVNPTISIAVSAHAFDVEACGNFVKSLLSDDVQYQLALNDCFPLNREAFRKAGYEAADYFNTVSVAVFIGPDGTTAKNRKTFTRDQIDMLEKAISSADGITRQDYDIDKILVEEMPAYFTGQKSLDEVVKIAQDRVQKVLGERG